MLADNRDEGASSPGKISRAPRRAFSMALAPAHRLYAMKRRLDARSRRQRHRRRRCYELVRWPIIAHGRNIVGWRCAPPTAEGGSTPDVRSLLAVERP